jgi:hypothetical protein
MGGLCSLTAKLHFPTWHYGMGILWRHGCSDPTFGEFYREELTSFIILLYVRRNYCTKEKTGGVKFE